MNNRNKVRQNIVPVIKLIIKILFYTIKYTFIALAHTFKYLSTVTTFFSKLYKRFKNRFYFSLTFKFTILYAFIFSIIMFICSAIILIFFKLNLLDKLFSSNSFSLNNGYLILLITINLLGFLISLAISSKMSNNILYPIKDMTYIVKDISVNHLDTRINIAGTKDELKELATTFNQMLDRLEKSYEQQNRFVSDASHELRTPIAVIQGYINLLDRWGKNDEAVLNESIQAIKSESQSMKELVEKLLFLARADKNTQKIEKNIFSLRSLIDQVTKETKLIDKNHLITNLVNEDIFYWGDEKLIKQTLRIFIDNSIKFTNDGGKITINSFKEINTICIEIEDTGMGIDKDDISKIFDRFYTTDKSRSKEYSGNGLGLSIAKWIISQHKGSIQVSSKLNFGTKIKIILPIL